MASPLAKQRQKLLAKTQAATAPEAISGGQPKSLHLLLAEMDTDLKVLKGFNRIEDKVTHKRDVLVPKYREAVEDYLDSGETFDNPLFAQMVVWMFDISELDTAIELCNKAIELGIDSPERFKRDFATFCADEVLGWSEKMAKTGHSVEPYFSQVFEKVRDQWRLGEQLTAKYYKFAGLHLLRDEDGEPRATCVGDIDTLEKAHGLLTEAENQYSKIGVGTMLKNIAQRIRAIEEGKNL